MKKSNLINTNKFAQLLLIFVLIIIYFSVNANAIGYPTPATLPATNILATSATLKGTVNPNGISTNVSFVSGDNPSSSSYFPSTPVQNIGNGGSPIEVSYDLKNLQPGTTYTYGVKAVNALGQIISSIVSFTTPIASPSEPQTLKATINTGTIILEWSTPITDGGSAITSYKIYRGITTGGETLFTTSNTLTITDTSVTSGQTYYYKVSAVNSAGEGVMSIEAPATVPLPPTTTVTVTVTPTTTATVTAPPPAPLTVIVTSESGSIGIGMTSDIKVTVLSDNKEISGADVMVSSSSGGRMNPGSGTTDLFGQFISTFTGTTEGIVSVRAIVRKSGFEDGKGAVQIIVGPAQTTVITPNNSQILQQKSYLTNANGNATKNDNITVPGEEDKTPTISGIKPESGFVVDFSIILYIVAFAGIIYLIYWKMIVKSKEEKTNKESVKKRICSNCGTENFGDNNFCEKCGKSLKP